MLRIACVGGLGRLGSEIVKLVEKREDVKVMYIVENPASSQIGEMVGDAKVVASILEVKDVDVFIDTTSAVALDKNISLYEKANKPVVIATTKLEEVEDRLNHLSTKIPLLSASNFDVKLLDFLNIISYASNLLSSDYGARVLEIHHSKKIDYPSGTAKTIVEAMKNSKNKQVFPPIEFSMAKKTIYENEFESIRITQSGEHDERISLIMNMAEEIYSDLKFETKLSCWYRGDSFKGSKYETPYLGTKITSIRTGDIVGTHSVCFVGDRSALRITHDVKTRSVFAKGAIDAAIILATKAPGRYSVGEIFGK